jgi:ubiquinone/menaquinone biosynthesis C-methylase UbiE
VKGHKWFASVYDKMLASQEKGYLGALREEMLKDVTGDVLEIGAGTGANFQYYPDGAKVVATEPDPYMMERAKKRAEAAGQNIELKQAPVEVLPFPDASFDFVIDTLVLCSVKDQGKALSEMKRVLRPGGQLRMYEHVRYENPVGALMQDIVSPAWQWFGAGCHPNRDTGRALREAGFEVLSVKISKPSPPIPPMLFTRPHLLAVARKPAPTQDIQK